MRVTDLYRHPVKSVGAERMERASLPAGRALPFDRVYAVTHGRTTFDPDAPAWTSCENFLRVANAPALAAVEVTSDPESGRFQARQADGATIDVDLSTDAGRAALAEWVAPFVESLVPGPYAVVSAPERAMTDADIEAVSIMSRASLRALSDRCGADLDPRRFRGNIWVDADRAAGGEPLAPWEELDWVGRELQVGATRLRILEPIERCMATAANPETGRRDAYPTRALKQAFGVPEFGVLAEVIEAGEVALGDAVALRP